MTSAYLVPYHGTDFTSLCGSLDGKRKWLPIFALTAFFLGSEGIAVGQAVHFYPRTAPVIVSCLFGTLIFFVCACVFFKQVTAPDMIPFKRAPV